ncbi:hypothetical protein [Thalassoroseus pseudoceratinae]|uniref:hypothetical protein n=1 Tax=Thalassoroseus pseudoceratinae TaxID=2713176 RepID=UPI0014236E28|nr:hypothetical protein [Thalassoroseus pseudoceratinae]
MSNPLTFAVTQADLEAGVVPGWLKLTITVLVFVLPFIVGNLLARGLKVREWGFKMSVILLATTVAAMPFLYQLIAGSYADTNYEAKLAEWEANQERFDISEETVAELEKRRENLRVMTSEADRSGEPLEETSPEGAPAESDTPSGTEG